MKPTTTEEIDEPYTCHTCGRVGDPFPRPDHRTWRECRLCRPLADRARWARSVEQHETLIRLRPDADTPEAFLCELAKEREKEKPILHESLSYAVANLAWWRANRSRLLPPEG